MIETPYIFELKNGIRIVHQPMKRAAAHCGLMIGAGSRNELKHEHGLAHFMEHCMFKGTEKRKTFHILSRLDAVGGELNAFTSKEETWIHASFLKEHFERAIELIADIAFNSNFPEKEIEKEKEVIVDELNSYKDSPAEMIFEEFDELVFGNHPIGRSILGSEKSLATFTRDHLIAFRDRNYNNKNLIFSSAGDIELDKLKSLIEKYFGDHKLQKAKPVRKVEAIHNTKHIIEKRDIHQVHYVMGAPAYEFHDERRPGLTLLNNILGGPAMNNRLSMNIRERHGIAYHIDSSYAPFSDCGIFSIYLGTEKSNLEKSKKLIWKELDILKNTRLSSRQLNESKKQIMAQIALAHDSGSAVMFSLAKSLFMFNRIDTVDEVFKRVQEITAVQLQDIAHEIFDKKKISSMTYTY